MAFRLILVIILAVTAASQAESGNEGVSRSNNKVKKLFSQSVDEDSYKPGVFNPGESNITHVKTKVRDGVKRLRKVKKLIDPSEYSYRSKFVSSGHVSTQVRDGKYLKVLKRRRIKVSPTSVVVKRVRDIESDKPKVKKRFAVKINRYRKPFSKMLTKNSLNEISSANQKIRRKVRGRKTTKANYKDLETTTLEFMSNNTTIAPINEDTHRITTQSSDEHHLTVKNFDKKSIKIFLQENQKIGQVVLVNGYPAIIKHRRVLKSNVKLPVVLQNIANIKIGQNNFQRGWNKIRRLLRAKVKPTKKPSDLLNTAEINITLRNGFDDLKSDVSNSSEIPSEQTLNKIFPMNKAKTSLKGSLKNSPHVFSTINEKQINNIDSSINFKVSAKMQSTTTLPIIMLLEHSQTNNELLFKKPTKFQVRPKNKSKVSTSPFSFTTQKSLELFKE